MQYSSNVYAFMCDYGLFSIVMGWLWGSDLGLASGLQLLLVAAHALGVEAGVSAQRAQGV